jgi:hypothetical protein
MRPLLYSIGMVQVFLHINIMIGFIIGFLVAWISQIIKDYQEK